MKKLIFALLVSGFFMISAKSTALANPYSIEDEKVEALFSSASEVIGVQVQSLQAGAMNGDVLSVQANEKNALVAILLDVLVGGIAIHRVYLGSTPAMIFYYLITCGGIFGIVPFVDLIVLAVNYDDISKYVDTNKFFMW